MTTPKRLKDLLAAGEFILAPGVFEMFSARIADRMGFQRALHDRLWRVGLASRAVPMPAWSTYTDMVGRARTIAEGTTTPLIADADTGFGGLINVRQTVRGYEAAGVQAIQIEDQEMPKKCGHTPNRRVVPLADMLRRIEVAVRSAPPRRHADHRAHRRPHRARPRRGDQARPGVRQGRRRRRVRRVAGIEPTSSAGSAIRSTPGCSPTWCRPASRPRCPRR